MTSLLLHGGALFWCFGVPLFDLYNPLFQIFSHVALCKKTSQISAGLLPAHFFHPQTVTFVVNHNHDTFTDILAFDGAKFGM